MLRTVSTDLSGFVRTSDGSFGGVFTVAALSTGTWTHVALTWDGSTLRGYKNATVGSTTYATTGNTNSASIATDKLGTTATSTTQHWDGQIAEVAIYRRVLSQGELTILTAGFTPPCLSGASRVFYAPLIREIPDLHGAAGTATGTAASDHPRIFQC